MDSVRRNSLRGFQLALKTCISRCHQVEHPGCKTDSLFILKDKSNKVKELLPWLERVGWSDYMDNEGNTLLHYLLAFGAIEGLTHPWLQDRMVRFHSMDVNQWGFRPWHFVLYLGGRQEEEAFLEWNQVQTVSQCYFPRDLENLILGYYGEPLGRKDWTPFLQQWAPQNIRDYCFTKDCNIVTTYQMAMFLGCTEAMNVIEQILLQPIDLDAKPPFLVKDHVLFYVEDQRRKREEQKKRNK